MILGDYFLDGPIYMKSGVTLDGTWIDESPTFSFLYLYESENFSNTAENGVIVIDGVTDAEVRYKLRAVTLRYGCTTLSSEAFRLGSSTLSPKTNVLRKINKDDPMTAKPRLVLKGSPSAKKYPNLDVIGSRVEESRRSGTDSEPSKCHLCKTRLKFILRWFHCGGVLSFGGDSGPTCVDSSVASLVRGTPEQGRLTLARVAMGTTLFCS